MNIQKYIHELAKVDKPLTRMDPHNKDITVITDQTLSDKDKNQLELIAGHVNIFTNSLKLFNEDPDFVASTVLLSEKLLKTTQWDSDKSASEANDRLITLLSNIALTQWRFNSKTPINSILDKIPFSSPEVRSQVESQFEDLGKKSFVHGTTLHVTLPKNIFSEKPISEKHVNKLLNLIDGFLRKNNNITKIRIVPNLILKQSQIEECIKSPILFTSCLLPPQCTFSDSDKRVAIHPQLLFRSGVIKNWLLTQSSNVEKLINFYDIDEKTYALIKKFVGPEGLIIDNSNVMPLLNAAFKLKMADLLKSCDESLFKNLEFKDVGHLFQWYATSKEHSLIGAQKKCELVLNNTLRKYTSEQRIALLNDIIANKIPIESVIKDVELKDCDIPLSRLLTQSSALNDTNQLVQWLAISREQSLKKTQRTCVQAVNDTVKNGTLEETTSILNKISAKDIPIESVIKDKVAREKALEVFSGIVIKAWEKSKKPLEEIIQSFDLNKEWKGEISKKFEFVGDKNKIFLFNNTLYSPYNDDLDEVTDLLGIALEQQKNKKPKTDAKKIQGLSVQIQGFSLLTFEQVKLCAENPLLLKAYLNPFNCKCGGEVRPIESQLLLKSGYLRTLIAFGGKDETLEFPETKPEVVALTQSFARDPKSIKINDTNVNDLLKFAEFLNFDELEKNCANYLIRRIRNSELDVENLTNLIIEYDSQNLQKLRNVCVDKLCQSGNLKGIIESLKKLSDEGIYIETINLKSNPNLTDLRLKTILELQPKIQNLSVEGCSALTTAIGPELQKLQDLKSLNLADCVQIDNNIAPHLVSLSKLQGLNMSACNITDDFLAQFLNRSNLRRLTLNRCSRISNKGLRFIRNHPLEYLSVAGHNTLTMIDSLKQFTELKQLILNDCPQLQSHFIQKLPKLEVLEVSGCEKLMPVLGMNLNECGNLKTLIISGKLLHDLFLSTLKDLKNLMRLKIEDGNLLTDHCGSSVSLLENLQTLEITNASQLTPEFLTKFMGHPSLRYINLSGCIGMNNTVVSSLQTMPKIKRVNFEGCPNVSQKVKEAYS